LKELIAAILVPQGPEYKAVCRGLSRLAVSTSVLPIPVGPQPVTTHLKRLQQNGLLNYQQPRVLLMGLCGSLNVRYPVGQAVLYQHCLYKSPATTLPCDVQLTAQVYDSLGKKATLVKALTCDRVITSAAEKRSLGEIYSADVVDMEGFAALDVLSRAGVAVAMLRVVSDDCCHNLPDLSSALGSDGSLKSLPLAIGLLRQPLAATVLIRGALRGLRGLQEVTTQLFCS